MWETGETDLQTARTCEDPGASKHYALEDAAQLDVVLTGLTETASSRRTLSHTHHRDFGRSST